MNTLHKLLLGLLLSFVAAFSVYEVNDELTDFAKGEETIWHVSIEILIVILSFAGLIYFVYLLRSQWKRQKQLEANLEKIRKDLDSSNTKLREGKKEYQKVIQWQFTDWSLSPSEKEIALLILKGLSIREIAKCRSTHEKTVRKQASAIYDKSNLAGRHELSAWFFEDML